MKLLTIFCDDAYVYITYVYKFPICIGNSAYIYICVSKFSVCSVVLRSHTMGIMANNYSKM